MRLQTVLLVLVSMFAFACNEQKVSQIAEKLSAEFNVPVDLIDAHDSDVCLTQQMRTLYREYEKLDQLDRDRFKDQIKGRYDRITLLGSKRAQSIEGAVASLTYIRFQCSSVSTSPRCYWARMAKKSISDDRVFRGAAPKTTVDQSALLKIQAQYGHDSSRKAYYWTDHSGFYKMVQKKNDQAFKEALGKRRLWLEETKINNRTFCGKVVHLDALI